MSTTYTTYRQLRSPTLLTLLTLTCSACSARLDVMDEPLGGGGSAGSGPEYLGGSAGEGTGAADTGGGGASGSAGYDSPGGASGSGPTSEGSCADQQQNGDEAGVDCGGRCATACVPCSCVNSDALAALGCNLSASAGAITGTSGSPVWINGDGRSVSFDFCYADGVCRAYYWSAETGPQELQVPGGAAVAGLSGDGEIVLLSPRVTLGTEAMFSDPFGNLVGTGLRNWPALLSADGVAIGITTTGEGENVLSRHALAGELEELDVLPFSLNYIRLVAVTPDGSTIVGVELSEGYRPFRWSDEEGLVVDFAVPPPANGATVYSMSRNGAAFSGITTEGFNFLNSYRWTEVSGVVEVAPTGGGYAGGFSTTALSDDGQQLAGSQLLPEGGDGAFRWSQAEGSTLLTPGVQSMGLLMSGDGSLIVGRTYENPAYSVFVWTEADGARYVRLTLEAAGVSFDGWQLGDPLALSADGRVLVGLGRCGGTDTVYRIVVPE